MIKTVSLLGFISSSALSIIMSSRQDLLWMLVWSLQVILWAYVYINEDK